MKKSIVIGLVCLLALFVCELHAQSDYFYYYLNGQQVSAEYNDTLIAIRIDTLINLTCPMVVGMFECLEHGYSNEYIGGGFNTYKLKPGYDLQASMEIIRQHEDMFMVNPVIMKRDTVPLYVNNQIVALFEEGIPYSNIELLAEIYNLVITEIMGDEYPVYYLLEFRGSTDMNILEIANYLSEDPVCRVAHPNFFCDFNNLLVEPQDPYFIEQWHLHNTGQSGGTEDADIDFPEAWEWNTDTSWQFRIALVDMGFEMDHEDLPANYLWSPIDIGGANIQNPGNQIDYDPSNPCDDPAPACWHGTMVLGLIAPIIDNSVGLSGITNNVKIKPIKYCDNYGWYSSTTILRSLQESHKVPFNAHIVCCPFFALDSSGTLANELESMYNKGIPVFFAAGNQSFVEFPANLPSVCAVGACDKNNSIISGSPSGSDLDLVAPGSEIWSFDLMGEAGINDSLDLCNGDMNYYCYYSGSSVSVAIVAGVAARVWATRPIIKTLILLYARITWQTQISASIFKIGLKRWLV